MRSEIEKLRIKIQETRIEFQLNISNEIRTFFTVVQFPEETEDDGEIEQSDGEDSVGQSDSDNTSLYSISEEAKDDSDATCGPSDFDD